MERLTRHEPKNNTQVMLNFAYASDGRVKLGYADGAADADLCEYIANQAAGSGCNSEPTPDEVMEGSCMECDCVLGILVNVATQTAELHARLMEIEDILGDTYDLEDLRCALVPKWIPATERLPEVGQRVIVARKGNKVEQGVFLGVNGWWKVYGANTKAVTHWMPLPEPPKE